MMEPKPGSHNDAADLRSDTNTKCITQSRHGRAIVDVSLILQGPSRGSSLDITGYRVRALDIVFPTCFDKSGARWRISENPLWMTSEIDVWR